MNTTQLVLLVLPLIAIQLGLMLFALKDLLEPDRTVRWGNKAIWAVIIILGELFGPLAYLAVGRQDA